jgi:hypothetical protein
MHAPATANEDAFAATDVPWAEALLDAQWLLVWAAAHRRRRAARGGG